MTDVLVVDDEPNLLRALVMNLAGRGYTVTSAATGSSAIQLADSDSPDLVILDLGLPDVDGLEVIRHIRQRDKRVPIIVLSARTASHDKVAALDAGASDYVAKPFAMEELAARLRASARRVSFDDQETTISLGPVLIDLTAHIVRRADAVPDSDPTESIRLTPTEWCMLETLLRRPGLLTTSSELLTAMRGGPEHTERSYLRIYMQQLRRKLEADPSRPRHLLTEPGLGYRYQP
jgi:two-component system KDP operon response regulator KdpE